MSSQLLIKIPTLLLNTREYYLSFITIGKYMHTC